MIPLNKTKWFTKQRQLEQDFVPTPVFVGKVVSLLPPVIAESKVNAVIRLLKRDGKVTAYDICRETNTTDPRTIARRLIKRGIIGSTTYERNATGNSNHAVYHYKKEA